MLPVNAHTNSMIRKLLASLLFATMALTVAAQGYRGNGYTVTRNSNYRDYRNIYWGLHLGATLSGNPSDESRLDGSKMRFGIVGGGLVGMQVISNLPIYVETGLHYVQKGGNKKDDNGKVSFSLEYLEVPIVAKYLVNIGYDATFQPFLGGYMAYGVGGKVKDFAQEKEEDSFSDQNFKRFDAGLRGGFALQFSMTYLEAAYDLGLYNIGHNRFGSTRTSTVSVCVGVNF